MSGRRGVSGDPSNANDGVGPLAFFSTPAANPDGDDHMTANEGDATGDGRIELRWEDLTDLGDADFNDVVMSINVSPVGEPTTPTNGDEEDDEEETPVV